MQDFTDAAKTFLVMLSEVAKPLEVLEKLGSACYGLYGRKGCDCPEEYVRSVIEEVLSDSRIKDTEIPAVLREYRKKYPLKMIAKWEVYLPAILANRWKESPCCPGSVVVQKQKIDLLHWLDDQLRYSGKHDGTLKTLWRFVGEKYDMLTVVDDYREMLAENHPALEPFREGIGKRIGLDKLLDSYEPFSNLVNNPATSFS